MAVTFFMGSRRERRVGVDDRSRYRPAEAGLREVQKGRDGQVGMLSTERVRCQSPGSLETGTPARQSQVGQVRSSERDGVSPRRALGTRLLIRHFFRWRTGSLKACEELSAFVSVWMRLGGVLVANCDSMDRLLEPIARHRLWHDVGKLN